VVSTAASQHQRPGFDSRLGSLSVWSLHILPMSARVSSGCSGFLPQSKDVWVRMIGHAKLSGGLARVNAWGYEVGPRWDCGRCRLDGPNGLLLHYDSMMVRSKLASAIGGTPSQIFGPFDINLVVIQSL